LFTLTAIIMSIIIVGSVSLIYNAFAISVSDRSRYLGMLSSVGATRKQKRNSVFFEGVVIGAISIPPGIIAGLAGIGITFYLINPMVKNALLMSENLRLVVLPVTIVLAVLISAITIFVSTWVPAKRASNISAVEAIRQTMDVKLTGREVRTSKFTRMIFGIEGDLALKNIKRNKRRYRATLFSIIISIILFLVVSQFTLNLKKSALLTQNGINFDIMVTIPEVNNTRDVIIESIKSLDNITSLSQIQKISANAKTDAGRLAEYYRKNYPVGQGNEEITFQVFINALDDESLLEYANEVGADFARLKDAENPGAIVIDTVKYRDTDENKYSEGKVVKLDIGEKLPVYAYDGELEKDVPLQPLEVIALTDKAPVGVIPGGLYANLHVVVSTETLTKITAGNENVAGSISTGLYIRSSNPLILQEDIEAIQKNLPDNAFYLYNVYLQNRREEQMIILISVFSYGFISLITAICIANIINTISTGIALRKREFAMLKSVGMTPESFKRMINYESLMYGFKAILFGLPVSFIIMYIMHLVLGMKFSFDFSLPWADIFVAVISVFLIVGTAMLYSGSRIQKENIVDALKQEFT
ncbi:MAG: ABC transporter permease, partial [Clostridiaceae bacterium]|nr:ABC transporter permease [Clostridiaceae bacterium]